jgi:hypothetical protein
MCVRASGIGSRAATGDPTPHNASRPATMNALRRINDGPAGRMNGVIMIAVLRYGVSLRGRHAIGNRRLRADDPGEAREQTMLLAMAAVTALILVTLLIHYEVLRLTASYLPGLTLVPPRFRIVFVMLACFAAHTVEVWVFALVYWGLDSLPDFGGFSGPAHPAFTLTDHVYFSVVTYTSLGLGDIYPTGNMRLIAGVEALTGLLMIGWSASFTYIEMRELWSFHRERRRRD